MNPWMFLFVGYLVTVAIEGLVLWFGLSPTHSRTRRLAAAFWLTACTYPVVVLVIPTIDFADSRGTFLLVAESFAIISECVLFAALFAAGSIYTRVRDVSVVAVANATSFVLGELWWHS